MQMNGHGPRPGYGKGKDEANKGMGKGGSTHGPGKGPDIYEEQGKGHRGKREEGKGHKWTDNNYEGKGNLAVHQGKDSDSLGKNGEQQQQWNSETWGTAETDITHGRGEDSWGDHYPGWKHRSASSWSVPHNGWR
jgi:hypothetical protein